MIVKVRLCAFKDGEIREVVLPEGETGLEAVFKWGQNDFQPSHTQPSVSVGDVIEWEGKLHCVTAQGFKEVTEEWYVWYMEVGQEERAKLIYYMVPPSW